MTLRRTERVVGQQVGLSKEFITKLWTKKAIFKDWKQGELMKWNSASVVF